MSLAMMGLAWVIFAFEIIFFAVIYSMAGRVISLSGAVQISFTSIAATITAWAVPTEFWFGSTLVQGAFEPWGVLSVFVFLFLVGVPAAVIVDHRVRK